MVGKLTLKDCRGQPLRRGVRRKPPHRIEQRVVAGLRSQKAADDPADRLSFPRIGERPRGFRLYRYGYVNGLGHADLLVRATLLAESAGEQRRPAFGHLTAVA
jgi:hypothetical protein